MARLAVPTSERQFVMYEALRKGVPVEELHRRTSIKPLVPRADARAGGAARRRSSPTAAASCRTELLRQAKQDGFADAYLAQLLGVSEVSIRAQRTGPASSRAGTRCR